MRKIYVLLVILFLSCGTIFGAEGDIIWTRTYNGTANDYDAGLDIGLDGSGNVYVTGWEWVVGEGLNIWVRKYNSSGNEIWTRTYNGAANGNDWGKGIAVDEMGNVHVTGYTEVTGEQDNIWVRKYDTEGNVVWTKTFNGTANGVDRGHAIGVDGSGNVYVTGYEEVVGEGYNIWVRKYDSAGEEVWTRTYNGTANGSDAGSGVVVDGNGNGNVYVTGNETVTGEGRNIWVRKYDLDGDVLWTRTYNGTANGDDCGLDIAIDISGNVYITGYTQVTGESGNVWERKYDTDGNVVWTRTYNGATNKHDVGNGIAVDVDGNVYVAGCEGITNGDSNIWVRKYDSEGEEVWTRTYNGIANGNDGSSDITVDRSGNVYVIGWERVIGQDLNIWLRKYEGPYGEHFEPLEEGNVKIQGGEKGYVNPRKNEKAKIHFQPTESGTVNVKIFTLNGLLVWEESKSVSGYQDFIEWNCRNKDNDVVASGIYAVRVEGPGIKTTKKVAILK